MKSPFFSIVIPVYNGLTHDLPKCLDSIWNQPLAKELYEVICVDDCSNDNTRAWLKEQQSTHRNLQIIENKHNIRQGGGRNNGVRAAKGEYIVFIDQDDYYHHNAIARVYDHLQNNDLDILIVDCAYQSPGKESNKLQHNFPHREIMTGDEIIEKNSIPYAPWKFIFKRSLMLEHKLFFVENERFEDVDWVHKLVHYGNKVQYQPILFIHYNKTSISTTMSAFCNKELIYCGLRVATRLNTIKNTIFLNSNENVKNEIQRIIELTYYINLRYFFFFYDNYHSKINIIKKSLQDYTVNPTYKLVKFAKQAPATFSIISNILSPICKIAFIIYRHIKYHL